MASIPSKPNLRPEDFPDQKWIDKLFEPLNRFFDDTVASLNKSLTFKENLSGTLLTVIVDGVYPLDVKWTLKEKPVAAWLGQVREVSNNHTVPAGAVSLDWEFTSKGAFRINSVLGITPTGSNKFNITIVAITG